MAGVSSVYPLASPAGDGALQYSVYCERGRLIWFDSKRAPSICAVSTRVYAHVLIPALFTLRLFIGDRVSPFLKGQDL